MHNVMRTERLLYYIEYHEMASYKKATSIAEMHF